MSQEPLNFSLLQAHIQQLKKLDDLIVRHHQHGQGASEFMTSQYEYRKEQLLKEIVAELVAHSFEDRLPEKMRILYQLLARFLPSHVEVQKGDRETNELEQLGSLLA